MLCLHSIPSGEEWVLVLHGSQHLHENSGDLREFPDYFFSSDYVYTKQKIYQCRFENLSICFSSYKNNNLKISYSESKEFSSYLPVKFVNFLKSKLIFNIFYCFGMFVNRLFTYLTCAYLKK